MYNATQQTQNDIYASITAGVVVACNDEQQWCRLRVMVPAYGDTPNTSLENIPWARPIQAVGGVYNNDLMHRGPDEDVTNGPIAYGFMPGVPGKGSIVAVTCINGDPMNRVWLGSLGLERLTHTLPSGRFRIDQKTGKPVGPESSTDTKYEPVYSTLKRAFGGFDSPEFITRGLDIPFAKIDPTKHTNPSGFADTDIKFKLRTGETIDLRSGYPKSPFQDGVADDASPDFGYWVSPGGHTIYMTDRPDWCRMVIKSAGGSRILLDDTNERMYVMTPHGNSWVEMDYDGTIDLYTRSSLSARTEGDVNVTSDQTIRLYGKQGVHIKSDTEIRMEAADSINVRAGTAFLLKTPHMATATSLLEHHTKQFRVTSDIIDLSARLTRHVGLIKQNSEPPVVVEPCDPAKTMTTKRIPMHEPWGRTDTKNDYTTEPKYEYSNENVGRGLSGRGKYWRR